MHNSASLYINISHQEYNSVTPADDETAHPQRF